MSNIEIKVNDITIIASLNDTVAAKDFQKRLPLTITGQDSGNDYCCVLEEGLFNAQEVQSGWKNGDINLSNGWFALLYGGEEESESYDNMMIIGHMDEENQSLVKNLPKAVVLSIHNQ